MDPWIRDRRGTDGEARQPATGNAGAPAPANGGRPGAHHTRERAMGGASALDHAGLRRYLLEYEDEE
jgi:hypothetical protein